jgi:hypothetical protein
MFTCSQVLRARKLSEGAAKPAGYAQVSSNFRTLAQFTFSSCSLISDINVLLLRKITARRLFFLQYSEVKFKIYKSQ